MELSTQLKGHRDGKAEMIAKKRKSDLVLCPVVHSKNKNLSESAFCNRRTTIRKTVFSLR